MTRKILRDHVARIVASHEVPQFLPTSYCILMADTAAKTELEFPLIPKKGRLYAEDFKKAFLVKPIPRIPVSLVPLSDTRLSPPKLHYGWVLDEPFRLHEIAKEMGVEPRKRKPLTPEQEAQSKPTASMTDIWLREDTLKAIAKNLKLRGDVRIITVFNPDTKTAQFISVVDNYALREKGIANRDLRKLRDFFGFDGKPMWYLDYYRWTWDVDQFWDMT
ncbi:hypothetical protein SCHPADRAFT_294840 [Schizopora paradoxa]|uniref:Uncharacterized protein n=1 Tax=Schizopora paradoxa TaxID=27342 RepID=A0A0H2SD04_9AGAM|nr:hypothetical protein SCHPADRAFT_294840 [Schizopora paradoxa]